MPSPRRQCRRERRAAAIAAAAKPAPKTRRAARPCERCGGRCRTDKPLYGWMCAECVKELDTYYMIRIMLGGGDVCSLYIEDMRRGTVPAAGFEDVPDPPWLR
jgi:hypothetical protein